MAENNKNDQKSTGGNSKQSGFFKKRRAGVVLTRDEVIEIKRGRRKLRKQMLDAGIKSKSEFELTASSLGLYFDENRKTALLLWFLSSKGFWLLLSLGALLLLLLYGMSAITSLRGHFTISMSDELFREGFSISETREFENPTSHLFATPAEDVPCISIVNIPDNVDEIDGAHHDRYFAYTFYVKNEGESAQNLLWQLRLNSESQNLSQSVWAMLFIDGEMTIYAKADDEGNPEMLPAKDDNTRGYLQPPFYQSAADPDGQYEVIKKSGALTYWRVKTKPFLSDSLVQEGLIEQFNPQDVHKITAVIWLEGDDPQCTNELIGGHLGMDFFMQIAE